MQTVLETIPLKQWLVGTTSLPIEDQYQAISDRFRPWKGDAEQVDEVLLVGLGCLDQRGSTVQIVVHTQSKNEAIHRSIGTRYSV